MSTHNPMPLRHRVALGALLAGGVGLATAATVATALPVTPAPPAAAAAAVEEGERWNRTELFFGTAQPDGTEVSAEEFDLFVDKSVTPRFPDGLTLLTGDGQFRGEDGELVQERSYLLILLHPADDPDADREIEEIRADYLAQFDQESVLRADSTEVVSF